MELSGASIALRRQNPLLSANISSFQALVLNGKKTNEQNQAVITDLWDASIALLRRSPLLSANSSSVQALEQRAELCTRARIFLRLSSPDSRSANLVIGIWNSSKARPASESERSFSAVINIAAKFSKRGATMGCSRPFQRTNLHTTMAPCNTPSTGYCNGGSSFRSGPI